MHLTLDKLMLCKQATLVDFTNKDLAIKLQEHGLLPGQELSVIIKSPLGCPLVVSFDNTQLTIRAKDAQEVLVETSNI